MNNKTIGMIFGGIAVIAIVLFIIILSQPKNEIDPRFPEPPKPQELEPIQNFAAEHNDTKTEIRKFDIGNNTDLHDLLKKNCGPNFKSGYYFKTMTTEPDNNEIQITWVDPKTKEVICAYRELTEEGIEKETGIIKEEIILLDVNPSEDDTLQYTFDLEDIYASEIGKNRMNLKIFLEFYNEADRGGTILVDKLPVDVNVLDANPIVWAGTNYIDLDQDMSKKIKRLQVTVK